MVSVCMATHNGSVFIQEQIDSILQQLGKNDELIISDDCSSDNTIMIIESYRDERIKVVKNLIKRGITRNFESSLTLSSGKHIFLADQDDVWLANKIKVMVNHLQYNDLVLSDCTITDHALKPEHNSFFKLNNSGKGFVKNIIKNSYMGCCMAFNRNVLNKALPFPHNIPIHDFWIGLVAEFYFRVHFISEPLLYHRRHSLNASSTGQDSIDSLKRKLYNRYYVVRNLLQN